MLIYIYDNSFEGLLTAIYEAYYKRENPDKILPRFDLQLSIIDIYISIETDLDKSLKVYNSIKNKISIEALEMVYNVFLSEDPDKETIIFEYLKQGWKIGRNILFHLSDECVLKMNKINQRVEHEAHKMTGFVRFRLIENNIYYAPVEPDNNIIELIAPHFAERFSEQNWIIHDVKRNHAVIYNCREWVVVHEAFDNVPDPDKGDLDYQKLWKGFFNSISIQNRTNLKLQKGLMPRRYWRNLTEKM
jgi:probable DNA metabolism protein